MSTAEIEDQSVRPPIAARRTRRPGAFVLSAAIVVATGLGILAALTANAGAPLLLAVLGVLAALGVFLVFGIIAGHIRVSERTSDYDLLTSVFETVDHGLLVTAADGTVISANTAARDLLGTGDGTALPPLSLALGGEPRVDAALFRLHRAVGRGISRTEEVELPARQPLRPSQFVKLTAHPLGRSHIDADYDGAIVWTLMDVSRDRAKEAQVRSDLTAQLDFYAGLPAGLIVADDRGTLQFVSDRMRQWLGLDSSGSDLAFSELAASDTAELLRNLVAPTGQHDRVLDVDLVDQKGYLWPARVVAAPFDPVTRTTTLLILQRQASEVSELSAGDDRAAAMNLLRSAPFGIATLAYNGRILAANAAFSNLLMTSISPRGDLAVDALARKADADTQAAIAAAIDMSLEGRAGIAPVEIAIGTDGAFTRRLLFGALDGAGRGGRDGERPVAVVYVIDATEQKALEQKFAQSQKMEVVGKLAGGIAHDFNNVMTAIIGFSDLLLRTHRPGDPAYQNIKNIRSSAERAAELVSNLLAFSRQQQLRPRLLHMPDVISNNVNMLQRALDERIELRIEHGRDLWPVKADQSEIERVLMNLAVNARDAMANGGRLTIRTRNVGERESIRLRHQGLTAGEYVLVQVEDTGTGMPPDVLAKIFEPFFTTKGIGKGTGLGLSSVYGIVKQTNGFIYPESVEGKGTTFNIYLPRAEVRDEDPVPAAEPQKPVKRIDPTGAGRVLLVEDEDAVRIFAVQALQQQGYEVFQASDGYEALEMFEQDGLEVDLVVSDVKMPEMDGPTLLKELRKTKPDLKFVFVSGYPADAFSNTLANETNYTFLPKPYSLERIAVTVKEQIGG